MSGTAGPLATASRGGGLGGRAGPGFFCLGGNGATGEAVLCCEIAGELEIGLSNLLTGGLGRFAVDSPVVSALYGPDGGASGSGSSCLANLAGTAGRAGTGLAAELEGDPASDASTP